MWGVFMTNVSYIHSRTRAIHNSPDTGPHRILMHPRMYPRPLLLLFCILATFLGLPTAWATSFVSMSDESLL